MGLTVKDVVQLPILETAKVKSGRHVLNETYVERVTVIELPVENFVKKNEFVLSTGIGCGDDPVLLMQFVKDVIASGASVLAFAVGKYIHKVPEQVLQLARNHDFIIIEIPWETRFGDILEIVLQKINEEKKGDRQHAELVRQELINCVLHGKSLQDMANLIYKHCKIPIVITDYSKQVRANCQFDEPTLRALCNNEHDRIQLIPQSNLFYNDHPLQHYLEEYIVDGQTYFQLSILNNEKKQGCLLFQLEDRGQLTSFVMNVFDHTLTACALYFVKENAIEMTKIRLKDNFILSLAKSNQDVNNRLISKAQLLGYDLKRPYICIVGEVSKKKADNNSKTSLENMIYYVQKEITSAGKLLHRKTMTTFEEAEVIIFIEADHQPYLETANQFLDILEGRLYSLLSGVILSWGVATHSDGQYVFHESYREAKTALDIGKKQKGLGERTFFSDTKINRLLMAISNEAEIANIVNDTIQPLLDYDRKRQTDLLYTFMIYNKYKGNVSQTARALNLHRQSLLHRLRNIESLTKLSLVNSDDLFLLELSVRLWMWKKI